MKRVIFLFMNGGLLHDRQLRSEADAREVRRPADARRRGQDRAPTGELMKSPFTFKKYGQCGMDISELWPNLGEVADDICWVRSVYTEIPNHEPSCLMMNTGANQAGRPSLGAWMTYGLGTENQEPARLRRAVPRRADHRRPAAVEQRLPARDQSGHVHFLAHPDRGPTRTLPWKRRSRRLPRMKKDKR